MNKPYVICHMTTSIDGKVTGDFLSIPESANAIDIYYQINRDYKADGYACGRVTMQGSFCGDYYPDLSPFSLLENYEDYIGEEFSGFYAIAFDTGGKLGWTNNKIIDVDGDPGYNKAQIIEVITEKADKRYLSYLKSLKIPYIIAGKDEIDINLALEKLNKYFNINTLLLEGGSILDGAFAKAKVIDELSLVVSPVIAKTKDKPLFMESDILNFKLKEVKQYVNGVLWLNYIKE